LKKIFKKTAVITFFTILIAAIILGMGISGCSVTEVTSETTSAETSSSPTSGTASSEETSESIEEKITGEITGNINILSGLELSDAVSGERPVAVMIENTPDARPQSGLVDADVVFEVEDEYGITRFVAIFSSYNSNMVGPVRSTRPYYAEIAAGFDPLYVFWGTHPSFYIVVQNLGLDYLSPLGDTSGASSIVGNFVDPGSGEGKDAIRDTTRKAPHNAYVRIPRMKEIAQEFGYSIEGGQSPLHFKEDASESDRGNIDYVTIDFSSDSYRADFSYDPQSNTYYRFVGGKENLDRETGEQIEVNNVVVLLTDIRNSGDAEGHMVIRTTQSGDAYYFIDGTVMEGTWSRTSPLDPFDFKDSDGKTVLFNRGQTWVAMISGIEQLEY
jgi:hypothetical protein